ncbi:hypothetical protein EZJ49_05115 [Bdellovibrio bacteriovorus]|uniref:hypothetical protein n=1 Tax=Bdellovibrio bacteriovorus TaxID=959 RepID=UPI0021D0BCA5|nr:hypothetical protein [Bdellovibrio bacteriovorus]UXR65631.1 hypothetical protein EZJ49_05115 [Bdellovibrio bacteriovorus]
MTSIFHIPAQGQVSFAGEWTILVFMNRWVRAVLTVEIVYLLVAALTPFLPGWKMFSRFEYPEKMQILRDDGSEVNLQKVLPPHIYSMSQGQALKLAAFVCRKYQNSTTWTLKYDDKEFVLENQNCQQN